MLRRLSTQHAVTRLCWLIDYLIIMRWDVQEHAGFIV